MSEKGEPDAEHRDWWARLYDSGTPDTGRARRPDTLDDRYDSVTRTLAGPGGAASGSAGARPAAAPERDLGRDLGRDFDGGAVGRVPVVGPDAAVEAVPDTVLEEGRCGAATLRAASVRGAGARTAGVPRGDALLVVRFDAGESGLVLAAVASGAYRATREATRSVAAALGRGSARLADDVREGRAEALRAGLHRVADRVFGRLRAQAAAQEAAPGAHTADLRCLLLPADPHCRARVFFGHGTGGLFRLREGTWCDMDPPHTEEDGAPAAPRPLVEPAREGRDSPERGGPARADPFRFRLWTAEAGDALLLCTEGLARAVRGAADSGARLAAAWRKPGGEPPGAAAYLTALVDGTAGHEGDRTAVTVWEE
ncbi:protein phosphatase 2C domain-containing protein [Streptomyces albus]|uniref:protein phosphatase 2C domain-containing protein n=1 Tax=Streptomyces albus TaxID=1888 RepID=UPI00370268EA